MRDTFGRILDAKHATRPKTAERTRVPDDNSLVPPPVNKPTTLRDSMEHSRRNSDTERHGHIQTKSRPIQRIRPRLNADGRPLPFLASPLPAHQQSPLLTANSASPVS